MEPYFSSADLAWLRVAAAGSVERCGLLLGDRATPTVVEAANVADDPATAFEIDPGVLLAAHRAARKDGGPAVLGCWHTHPTGDPSPSPRDAAAAAPDGQWWLIAGTGGVRLWRAVAHGAVHGRFEPVRFGVTGGGHVETGGERVQQVRPRADRSAAEPGDVRVADQFR